MSSKQLKLGKSKPVYEEECYICSKEVQEPNFYKDGFNTSYTLCGKHYNWKFKAIIEFLTPLLILIIPFVVFASLFGVEDKLLKTLDWLKAKLEEADT